MKFRKFLDNFVLVFALISFFGFFLIFTQIFSGNLEKFVLGKNAYSVSNISASLEIFTINTESAYLQELNDSNEKVLFTKNENKVLPIASLTKLVSAMIVIDNIKLDEKIIITKDIEDWQEIKTIKSGEVFTAGNLLKTSLIESNNSAIIALSDIIGQEKFVELMNIKAKEIGLAETRFFNETGLDLKVNDIYESNYSTAKDLARLVKYILQNYPEIFEITKEKDILLPVSPKLASEGGCDVNNENCRVVKNTNKLLISDNLGNRILGGKTGETKIAGGCLLLVLNSKNNEDILISVVLNSQNRFIDTEKIINKYGD